MVDDGVRVRLAEPDAGGVQHLVGRVPGVVDEAGRQARQLRHPAPDVGAFGIEPLALHDRVEDPEVGLGVEAASGGPLPAGVVLRPIAVGQVLQVVRLAAAVVDQEVLGEEAGRDHPRAVVDEALAEELSRGGVDHRIAGLAARPRLPVCIVAPPRETGEGAAERPLEEVGVVPERAVGELAPEELVAERLVLDGVPHTAHRERAEPEVRRQPAGAGEVQAIAPLGVAGRALLEEAGEPAERRRLAAGEDRRVRRDAERLAGRDGDDLGVDVAGERRQPARRRVRAADRRGGAESASEVGEHRVRRAGGGAQGAGREEGLALVEGEAIAERLPDPPVQLAGERLDPALRDDPVGAPGAGQRRHDLDAPAGDDQEARPAAGDPVGERPQ